MRRKQTTRRFLDLGAWLRCGASAQKMNADASASAFKIAGLKPNKKAVEQSETERIEIPENGLAIFKDPDNVDGVVRWPPSQ